VKNEFWVLQRLFKAIIAVIDWADYAGLIGYQGPQQPANMDPGPLQLRWLLHPALGLPLSPFTVWHNVHPGGSPTPQELADLPNWEPIEQVGLPVDASWRDTGYDLSDQGPAGAPLLSPVDAAYQRLQLGAPRIGWPGVTVNGTALSDWAPPDLDAYLVDVLRGALLGGIQQMLTDRPDPSQHAAYLLNAGDGNGSGNLNPHLLGDASVVGAPDQPASAAWHPLGLLLLAAGTDTLASLCLGFGTATRRYEFEGDIYMVSVRHKLRIGPEVLELQLADVVVPGEQPAPPVPPQAVAAALLGHTRAQTTDGPAIDTVEVSWERPSNPSFGHLPPGSPRPVSYALGRFDSSRASQILLSPRPEAVRGWQPFAPSKPDDDGPAGFADHLVREATIDGQVYGQPLGEDHTYAVAAEDLFGRFSGWSTVAYTDEDESPPTPPVLSVSLDPSGGLSIDFGWDWSTRSPEFIDLSGAFADDPGTPLIEVRLQFAGNPDPDTGGGEIIPLSPDLVEVATFGEAQDDDASAAETRFYRLRATLPGVVFGAATEKVFQVQARGQCHLTEMLLPGWGVGPWGTPVATTVRDPAPPPAPGGIPEAPQWASTPDTSGVSRAVLGWTGVENVSGYVLYEATETALLGALSLPGPDPSRSYVDRLADLRGSDLPSLRQVFRRVVQDLIPASSYEVELPRGSTVMHLYAVTAIGNNQVESSFPGSSHGFFAVAAARAPVPAPPWVTVAVNGQPGQPVLHVTVNVEENPAVARIELYRITDDAMALSADTMGRPIAVLTPANGVAQFDDTTVASGWSRVWYRAVAWTATDAQLGLVATRSAASNAASVLVLPQAGPEVSDLTLDEPGSTVTDALASWKTSAPAGTSPLGPHTAVITVGAAGLVATRATAELDSVPTFASPAELPPADPANRSIFLVGTATSYRLYAWLPRPAAGQQFTVTAKVIDPLGRLAIAEGTLAP
jgi:hypothetical protein